MRTMGWLGLMLGFALLGGCTAWSPSVGVGIGIPYTPIGIGVGVPLWHDLRGGPVDMIYRPLDVASIPPGGEIYVNDGLVGTAPMTIQVPFPKGYWGEAAGSARLMVRKPGYLPQGVQLFPASEGRVATSPKGNPIGKLEVELRPER